MNILIAGDFCPQYRVASLLNNEDYQTVFGLIQDVILRADYSLVNFECPIADNNDKPIRKIGPNLRCTANGLKALKWAGFKGVTLANNHFNDFGEGGIKNTLDACESIGLDYVGGGINLHDASKTLYKEVKGKILAIINCCEHEFSIATENTAGSNPLNPIQQYYSIIEAKTKADYVLIIVHGGHEFYQLPSPRMQETYRFFIDAGADAVVNHHQHCYSGYEIYKSKPIFYGLGNFCFDKINKKGSIWNEGYTVEIKFNDVIDFDIYPYIQCSDSASVKLLPQNVFDTKLKELNSIISDKIRLEREKEKYFELCMESYSKIFEPLYCRIYFALRHRGLFPSLITKKRLIRAENYICCESHRDKLFYLFKYFDYFNCNN